MPNAELLRQVLEEIESDPRHWSPDVIARREDDEYDLITYGVEGQAVALAHPDALWHWVPESGWERFGFAWFAVLVSVDGSRKTPGRHAAYVARKLLGLDREQAERLFGARSIDELRQVVAELCDAAAS